MHSDWKEDADMAVQTLRQGGIILYPTDTVWGIGCDAANQNAVQDIFKLKQREDSKSMLTLMSDIAMVSRYFPETEDIAFDLMEAAYTPLTLVLPGAQHVASGLIAEDGSMGVRIPDDQFCQYLIEQLHRPIVSTSANISGQPGATVYDSISDDIKNGVDYICRHRRYEKEPGKPSSIIKLLSGGVFKILRK